MSQSAAESGHRRSRKPERAPGWVPKSDGGNGNVKSCRGRKGFVFLSFKGMGCRSISMHPSTQGIIRSAAEWEGKGGSKRAGSQRRNKGMRDPVNVAVDVPDVCCAPPGIGFSSHFPTRIKNLPFPRNDRVKHSGEAATRTGNGPKDEDQFADEIIEMMVSQQTLLTGTRISHDQLWAPDDETGLRFERSFGRRVPSSLRELDPYHDWRLDVDDMSYEELLNLGDRIGYVGTGLQEEEIPGCLRIKWRFNDDLPAPLAANDAQGEWKCSICQEKYASNNEIGVLGCGHHHHVDCIKQWLLKKNSCPICKSAAMQRKSG